ncbi:hypothetical protein EDD86DRAFT_250411 [Gorgonomyces haynaldii]|nr:hypothetical protein EDD86DRAFT_250411 [Gorgonomyces haynaldii]
MVCSVLSVCSTCIYSFYVDNLISPHPVSIGFAPSIVLTSSFLVSLNRMIINVCCLMLLYAFFKDRHYIWITYVCLWILAVVMRLAVTAMLFLLYLPLTQTSSNSAYLGNSPLFEVFTIIAMILALCESMFVLPATFLFLYEIIRHFGLGWYDLLTNPHFSTGKYVLFILLRCVSAYSTIRTALTGSPDALYDMNQGINFIWSQD